MDTSGRNPWIVLGIPEDATLLDVKRGFRDRVKQTHPDAGGDAREFASVKEAYDATCLTASRELPTSQRRRQTPYDTWLQPDRSTRSWVDMAPFPTFSSPVDFVQILEAEMERVGRPIAA